MERKKKKLSTEDHHHDSDQETLHRLFNKKFVYTKNSQWSLNSTSVFSPFLPTSTTTQHSAARHQDAKCVAKDTPAQTEVPVQSERSLETERQETAETDASQFQQGLQDGDRREDGVSRENSGRETDMVSEPNQDVAKRDGRKDNKSPELSTDASNETESGERKTDDLNGSGKRKTDDSNKSSERKTNMFSELNSSPVAASSPSGYHGDSALHNSQLKSPHYQLGRHAPPNKFRRKTPAALCRLKRVKVTLPHPWQCDHLIGEKDKLNALKDRLSDKDMMVWHQHTSSTNLAGKVVGEVKTQYNAELCTQAWCKFHEILASCDVLPASLWARPDSKLTSVHLCEAPGAFITSLNHYLVSRGFDTHKNWRWVGTTLNPYYEGNDTGRMISDDRFIRLTFRNWFLGRDNSGDLMCGHNMLGLMEHTQRLGEVTLITADGSIDCQEDPAEQEVIVSRLHLCEVLCSCLLLAPGGTLVIKLFTMFEASSIALLYFLNCVFEKVTVCKPATSKAGNSEVYTVCSGYTAPLSHHCLFSVFCAVCASEDPHVVLLSQEEIPDDFLSTHIECCLYFSQRQSDTISRNLQLFGNMKEEERKRIEHQQDLCVDHYVALCRLQPIQDGDRIRPRRFRSTFNRFSNCRNNNHHHNNTNNNNNNNAATTRHNRHSHHHNHNQHHHHQHHHYRQHSGGSGSTDPGIVGIGSSAASLPAHRLQGTFQERQRQNRSPWQQLLGQMAYGGEGGAGVEEESRFESMAIKCQHVLEKEEMQEWGVLKGRAVSAVASSQFCDSRLLGDLQLMKQHAQVKFHQQKAWDQHAVTALNQALSLLASSTIFTNHHHHHHTTTTTTRVYHLPLDGSVTSFWPPESPELSSTSPHHRLTSLDQLKGLEGEGVVGVVVDVTLPGGGVGLGAGEKGERKEEEEGEEEVRCQSRLVGVLLHVCSYLQSGSTVVIIMPPALTRLTAGLLYLFAGLFDETSFSSTGGQSLFLHQTLCFHRLYDTPYPLLHLLETLRHALSPPSPSSHSTPSPSSPSSLPPSHPARRLSFAGDDSTEMACDDNSLSTVFVDDDGGGGGGGGGGDGGDGGGGGGGGGDGSGGDGGEGEGGGGSSSSANSGGDGWCHDAEDVSCRVMSRVSCGSGHDGGVSRHGLGLGQDVGDVSHDGSTHDNRGVTHHGSTHDGKNSHSKGENCRVGPENRMTAESSHLYANTKERSQYSHSPTSSHTESAQTMGLLHSDPSLGSINNGSTASSSMKMSFSASGSMENDSRASGSMDNSSRGSSSMANSSRGPGSMENDSRASGSMDNSSRGYGSMKMSSSASGSLENDSRASGSMDNGSRASSSMNNSSRGSGNMGNSSLRTKRSRMLCDDSVHDRWSPSTEPRQGGGGDGGGGGGGGQFDWESGSVSEVTEVGGVVATQLVPLEVVPVLEIVNDVTFTRFLQSSHRHNVTRFLTAMKSAEQRLLSGNQSKPSPVT